MITATETALEDQTRLLVAPFSMKVEPFPDNPDNYIPTHPTGTVLVVYKGSAYGPAQATDLVIQDREMDFELTILIRNLRKHQGAYAVIEALRLGVAGWMAPGANRGARLVRDEFRGHESGIWHWALGIRIPTTSMPPFIPEESFGSISAASAYQELP